MKVLHVMSDVSWGGAGSYLLTLLGQCSALPCDPLVACPSGSQLIAPLEELGVPTFTYGVGERSFHPLDAQRLYGLMGRIRPRLVHTHASLSARVAARGQGVATVYTKHGLSHHGAWAARGHWLLPAGVIAVSRAVEQQLLASGLPPQDLTVIPNGIDVDRLQERARQVEPWHQQLQHPGSPLFAYAGRLSPEKGPDLLLEAAGYVLAACPEARLAYFGVGPLREQLLQDIASRGLASQVQLYGFVSNLPAALRHVDLLVLPSRSEGLPLVLLEAMGLGIPVVATAVGGVPELVEDGVSGYLVPPEEPRELASHVLAAWRDRPWRERASQRAQQRVRDHFSAKDMARRTFNFYCDRLGVRPGE